MTDPVEGPDHAAEVLNPQVDRRLRQLPRLASQATRLVWAAAPRELLLSGGLQLLAGALLIAQLIVARSLLSKLLTAQRGADYTSLVPEIVLLTAILTIVGVANVSRLGFQQLLSELVSRHAFRQVISVAVDADLATLETASFHDRLERAMLNASARPLQMTTGVLSLTGSMFAVIGISIALITIQPLLFLIAIVAVVPLWLASLAAGRSLYRFGFRQAQRDRRRMYLQLLLTHRDSAKELRAYGLGEPLMRRYLDLYGQRIDELRGVLRGRVLRGVLGSLATSALMGGALGFLVWLIRSHRLSLASAGAAGAALLLLVTQLQGLVSGTAQLYESALFIQDFSSFVKDGVPPSAFTGTARPSQPFECLAADAVTFTYAGAARPALNDVSVSLRRGEVVALVGENGSGKSTLAKLLAGLYQPEAGAVRWNEADSRGVDIEALRDHVAVLFQDFVHYQLSVRENIAFGRHRKESQEHFADLLAEAARRGGARGLIETLPAGMETQVGPQFAGGTELSGGQWQRIALARAFFRDAPIVILDEPTAALDPRAEAELFGSVRELFHGRTVLLISHRFASVRDADRIYVLDDGQVVEEGTHQELMDRQELYAELYTLQAAVYQAT